MLAMASACIITIEFLEPSKVATMMTRFYRRAFSWKVTKKCRDRGLFGRGKTAATLITCGEEATSNCSGQIDGDVSMKELGHSSCCVCMRCSSSLRTTC